MQDILYQKNQNILEKTKYFFYLILERVCVWGGGQNSMFIYPFFLSNCHFSTKGFGHLSDKIFNILR